MNYLDELKKLIANKGMKARGRWDYLRTLPEDDPEYPGHNDETFAESHYRRGVYDSCVELLDELIQIQGKAKNETE